MSHRIPASAIPALGSLTTFGIGGPADALIEVSSPDSAAAACAQLRLEGTPITFLGGGSNVLVSDAGVRGAVIRFHGGQILRPAPDVVRVEGGVTVNGLVRWCIGHGLGGFEAWLCPAQRPLPKLTPTAEPTAEPTAVPAEPGWLKIHCLTQSQAHWLAEAIIQENVQARHDGTRLFVPVGDDFRQKYEIKNVITAVAKTTHYWQDHLALEVKQALVLQVKVATLWHKLRKVVGTH